ncbi:hypothetical protein [Streptomyces sp. NPDC050287]|uniref:hypothetical protein n=1 Tax=Streptomyces sp. NPDC050287 TaxID=3365608 RepID=UPI0037AD65A7
MRRPGPALRVGLLGVTSTLMGCALLAAWLGWHAYQYDSARDRATARSNGVVVEDGIGDEDDIRVRWTDQTGHEHVQRFGVYDNDRYTKGRRFPVAYDPHKPDPRGFPADPDETAAEDDLLVPIGLAGTVAVGFCAAWAWRGLRFRRTARKTGRPMVASVRRGERTGTATWLSDTTWLALAEPDQPDRPVAWQRVMWHPAVEDWSGPIAVTVHGSARSRGPLVTQLPGGTRLVPLRRLLHHPPLHALLDDQDAVRADPRDFFTPVDTTTPPAWPWWRPGAQAFAVGAVFGLVAGFLITNGSVVAAVSFALSAGTLFTASWALSAPQP